MSEWNDKNQRSDGYSVIQLRTTNWIIRKPDKTTVLDYCPCCDKPLETLAAARKVCDAVYPQEKAP